MRSRRVARAICMVIGISLLSGGVASTYGSGHSQNAENRVYGTFTMTFLVVSAFILILASIFAVAAYLDYHHLRSLRSTTRSRSSQDVFPHPSEDGLRTLLESPEI
jgi:heme/copper-type cytochrome/quinol oxidase subunit 2